jgi:hypothetical protein
LCIDLFTHSSPTSCASKPAFRRRNWRHLRYTCCLEKIERRRRTSDKGKKERNQVTTPCIPQTPRATSHRKAPPLLPYHLPTDVYPPRPSMRQPCRSNHHRTPSFFALPNSATINPTLTGKAPSVLRYTLILLKARPTPSDIGILSEYAEARSPTTPSTSIPTFRYEEGYSGSRPRRRERRQIETPPPPYEP